MAVLAAVGAHAALTIAVGGGWVAGGAAAGVVLLVLGVALGRGAPAYWGVGLVGATYVASLFVRPERFDQSGVLYAVALLASAELSSWSIDSRRRGLDDLAVHIHRLRAIALALAAGIALAAVAEGAASFGAGGTLVAAVASAAVVAAVVATSVLVWRIRLNE